MNGDWRHKKAEKEEGEGGRLGASGGGGGDSQFSFRSSSQEGPFQQKWQVSRPVRPIVSVHLVLYYREKGLNLRDPD